MNEINTFTPSHPLKTAVLFLTFNRLDTTKKVFEAIRQAKPPRLYVAADGPRIDRPGEDKQVQSVKDYIMNSIDWNCEVKTLFRENNLGCKYAVSGAISWFFENEERGIILEDDCLPSQSFFWFCEDLLERYENDMRIAQISGFNFGYKNENLKYDYFFSKYPEIWGWATWKDRWCRCDIEMSNYGEIIQSRQLECIFKNSETCEIKKKMQNAKNGLVDSWGYPWSLNHYINRQYSLIPRVNLINNIGFDRDDATHTKGKNPYINNISDIPFVPIKHPKYIYELQSYYNHINKKSFFARLRDIFR